MLPSDSAQKVINQGMALGANFVDVFVEEHQTSTIQLLSSDVNEINAGVDFGIGVRLIYGIATVSQATFQRLRAFEGVSGRPLSISLSLNESPAH